MIWTLSYAPEATAVTLSVATLSPERFVAVMVDWDFTPLPDALRGLTALDDALDDALPRRVLERLHERHCARLREAPVKGVSAAVVVASLREARCAWAGDVVVQITTAASTWNSTPHTLASDLARAGVEILSDHDSVVTRVVGPTNALQVDEHAVVSEPIVSATLSARSPRLAPSRAETIVAPLKSVERVTDRVVFRRGHEAPTLGG